MNGNNAKATCKFVTFKEVSDDLGSGKVYVAYCGNGPAHGMQSGHYPLYQGSSQDDASKVGQRHAQETGHPTYVWSHEG